MFRGSHASSTPRQRHRCAQNADYLARNSPFSPVFAEVVCTLGTTPTKTTLGLPPNGGNGVIRTTTCRRHAASQALMVQTPTATGMASAGGTPGPGRGAGGIGRRCCWARGPRCPWATGPGRATSRRAKPTNSMPGPTGVEGAGGICRGAGRRWRGLAGLRDDAPSEARRADGSRAGRRPPAHTAAGPSSARNTSGATSNAINRAGRPRRSPAPRPGPRLTTVHTRAQTRINAGGRTDTRSARPPDRQATMRLRASRRRA